MSTRSIARHRGIPRYQAVLVGLAMVMLLAVTGCSYSNNESGETSVVYNGGVTGSTNKAFDKCVPAAQGESIGTNDSEYKYPANTRDFEFGREGAERPTAIEVVTKDNVTMTVTGIFNFALNTNCEGEGDNKGGMIRKFHEQIGTHYGASSEGLKQWDSMLVKYVGQPLERALDDASKQYTWVELYSGSKKPEWEKKVADLMTNYSKAQTGRDYFCEPNYRGVGNCGEPTLTVQQPSPPQTIKDALTASQAALEQVKAAENENKAAAAKARGIKSLVDVLGPQGYVLYQAMQDGRITLMPIPQGSGINVPAK